MTGFSVHVRRSQIDSIWIDRFRNLPVANVSDAMSRMYSGGSRIRPMHDGTSMAGIALTVKTRPGDNLMLHKALTMAAPGDVVVVDAGGDLTNALFGELMLQYAAHRGICGVVVDGAIRDSAAIRAQSLPVFAAGLTHRGPFRDGPGTINLPIAMDGMVITPGDLIIGDADGVLCIPQDVVEVVHALAERKQADETRAAAQGALSIFDRDWIDRELEHRKCRIET